MNERRIHVENSNELDRDRCVCPLLSSIVRVLPKQLFDVHFLSQLVRTEFLVSKSIRTKVSKLWKE
jgi:hypothetical protein